MRFGCPLRSPFLRAGQCRAVQEPGLPPWLPGAAALPGIPLILLFLAASDEVIISTSPLTPGLLGVPWHVRC